MGSQLGVESCRFYIKRLCLKLGGIADVEGRLAEAEPLYKRALEGLERVLGKEHPDTLTSVNNLALLYQAEGRLAEAQPLYKRALEARERLLGKEDAGAHRPPR
jgi:tetratricopeptide (TPR) repeat protein